MKLFFFTIVLLSSIGSYSQTWGDQENVSSIGCIPWSVLVEFLEFKNAKELDDTQQRHMRVQNFLSVSNDKIEKFLKEGKTFSVILNCAWVEEIMGSFDNSCLDENNLPLVVKETVQLCQSFKIN